MSYRVDYTGGGMRTELSEGKTGGWGWMIGGLVLMLLLLVCFLPQMRAWAVEALLPGDPEVTLSALDTMLTELKAGVELRDAVTAFCQEIVSHGTY